MAQKSSLLIYYQKVLSNSKRCLDEAREKYHPDAKVTSKLKDPKSNILVEVMSVEKAIRWCVDNHLPSWSQPTWRMHRCGYRLLLKKKLEQGEVSKEEHDALLKLMKESQGLTKAQRVKKTSSKRKKVITYDHIMMIEELVTKKKSKWGQALVIFLKAAVATGLRPNEWRTAELNSDASGRLIVKSVNFKANEVRSYAPYREIDITGIPENFIDSVKKQIDIVKGITENGLIDDYMTGCSSLLYWCNQKLWPKRKANLTLYTGRHQFSANAKASKDVSEVERAAMMGHKTTVTSRERYGKTRTGNQGLTPKIADENVLRKINNPEIKKRRNFADSPSLAPKQK